MTESREPRLSNCPRCRAIFVRDMSCVCPKCIHAEDTDYSLIRDALAANPELGPEALAHTAGVPLSCVMRMIDEQQLASDSPNNGAICGQCGEEAISQAKRLCIACLLDLDRRLGEELRVAQLNKRPPVRGVARHVHEVLTAKRRG